MVAMVEEKNELKESRTTFANYEKVKEAITDAYTLCKKQLVLLRMEHIWKPTHEDVMEFKTNLVYNLWVEMRDYMNSPYNKEDFTELNILDEYYFGKRSLKTLRLADARRYLAKIKTLMKAVGITEITQNRTDARDLPGELVGE
jgi:hypothetical protein